MALRLIIDGYNLICAKDRSFVGDFGGASFGLPDITEARELLLESLLVYKRVKHARITVVFDGTSGARLGGGREMHKGVEVLFSKAGVTADDVIKDMVRSTGTGLTVVTSDRDVASATEVAGAVVVSSEEFLELLQMAEYSELKGADMEDEDEDGGTWQKKGPARKPSKKERQRLKRLKKM